MQTMALAELDATIKEFNGDPDRIYLTGFSQGGNGVLRMASKWPERFAAIVDVAGFVKPDLFPGRHAEVLNEDLRSHPFLRTGNPYTVTAERIKKVPIWIFHGDADSSIPVSESRQLVAALKSLGATVLYTEYPDTEHSPSNVNVWQRKTSLLGFSDSVEKDRF